MVGRDGESESGIGKPGTMLYLQFSFSDKHMSC